MKELVDIAREVRKRCEEFSFSEKARDYDFYMQADLSCMCGVASFALSVALDGENIINRVFCGEYRRNINDDWKFGETHCWVCVNGRIVDITATQFGVKEKVHIVSACNRHYIKGKVVNFDDFKDWDRQKPSVELVSKIIKK